MYDFFYGPGINFGIGSPRMLAVGEEWSESPRK
jgi:hypothetical protein